MADDPFFHIASLLAGWDRPNPERHHDPIDAGDGPLRWLGWPLTMDVEANAKELTMTRRIAELNSEGRSRVR